MCSPLDLKSIENMMNRLSGYVETLFKLSDIQKIKNIRSNNQLLNWVVNLIQLKVKFSLRFSLQTNERFIINDCYSSYEIDSIIIINQYL